MHTVTTSTCNGQKKCEINIKPLLLLIAEQKRMYYNKGKWSHHYEGGV